MFRLIDIIPRTLLSHNILLFQAFIGSLDTISTHKIYYKRRKIGWKLGVEMIVLRCSVYLRFLEMNKIVSMRSPKRCL